MTMLAFVSSDSISAVYAPLCMVRPPLIIFFILVILTVSVSLMNLVTAILVEGALANAANDKELSRHDLKAKAQRSLWPKTFSKAYWESTCFCLLSCFFNGSITTSKLTKEGIKTLEVKKFAPKIMDAPRRQKRAIDCHSEPQVFEDIDRDGNGIIDREEFL